MGRRQVVVHLVSSARIYWDKPYYWKPPEAFMPEAFISNNKLRFFHVAFRHRRYASSSWKRGTIRSRLL
jgi:hypothetical protein